MPELRPLRWFGPSRREVGALPDDVKRRIGFRLRRLQNGEEAHDENIRAFGEDRRLRGIVKLVADGEDGNTYRTAVAASFPEGLWVIDVFEKRASSGVGTPKKDLDRIVSRLARLRAFRESEEGRQEIRAMLDEADRSRAERGLGGRGR
ncbi:type II toxin-antitoxin system RelE/ParE family toxin [Salinarimonas rosea]|uniref:type II toxin-antitoxin system RelE/ParE family toxin n=1 Tax=Salinarimonas rosea TaxID=552063 RepID=UPI0009FBC840|nr:type II toxin-antitoxin system RelE/ParE family toxin [Salinarimonas rosea]